METILIIFHVLLCIFLIAVVLLQTSRGAEIGAAFGGASRTLFGASGAPTVMGKITAAVAILFMLTSIVLTRYSERPHVKSIMDKPQQSAPMTVLPEAKPVQPNEAQEGKGQEKQNSPTSQTK
ncbi:MAG: preprotein translocase subunit SecG [Syntrophobacterales bacterium]|nr:preprotein translocase subunit SecG [Syntrophobacterales bacterium]